MANPTFKKIRKAVEEHHAGTPVFTDTQIRILWGFIPKNEQDRYLKQGEQDASSTGLTTNVSDSTRDGQG